MVRGFIEVETTVTVHYVRGRLIDQINLQDQVKQQVCVRQMMFLSCWPVPLTCQY